MTIRFSKILFTYFLIFTSLLITACTEGDRGFVPRDFDPIEEDDPGIILNVSGIKGPLINAEINLFRIDLSEGQISVHNDASQAFSKALNEANGSLADLQNKVASLAYVSPLSTLKDQVSKASSTKEAEAFIDAYLGESLDDAARTILETYFAEVIKAYEGESDSATDSNTRLDQVLSSLIEQNDIPKDKIAKIKGSYASLTDLKNRVELTDTLIDKLSKDDSFSKAKTIITKYKNNAPESTKTEWDALLNTLKQTKADKSSLSSIVKKFDDDVFDVYFKNTGKAPDAEAEENLTDLEASLNKASSVNKAQKLISKAYDREGSVLVKPLLSKLLRSITSYEDFLDEAKEQEHLTNYQNIAHHIRISTSFDFAIQRVTQALSNNLENAIRSSFKVLKKEDDDPTNVLNYSNLMHFGVSDETSLVQNLTLGDYRGFVYIEVLSNDKTLDLNTSKRPFITSLESVIHTDSILGYGDNQKKNSTHTILVDGVIQLDEKGEFITSTADLIDVDDNDDILHVRPYRTVTPLTSLGLKLAIEKLKLLPFEHSDINGDGELNLGITENDFKLTLQSASDDINDIFSIVANKTSNVFDDPVHLTPSMEFFAEEQIDAINNRANIENFSAYLYELMNLAHLDANVVLDAIVLDALDGEIDGLNFSKALSETYDELNAVPDFGYLVKRSSDDVYIPDTSFIIDDTLTLIKQQLSQTTPTLLLNKVIAATNVPSFEIAKGGIDSDGDGVFDNSDAFPEDSARDNNTPDNYKGLNFVNITDPLKELMPLAENYTFTADVVVSNEICPEMPCVSVGDASIPVIDSYELISAPDNHDFDIQEPNDLDLVGFTASATVPGKYLVKGMLSTTDDSVSPFTVTKSFLVEITLIDITDDEVINIKFGCDADSSNCDEPSIPKAGESLSTKFEVTEQLCQLYSFCDRDEVDIGDYLDISELSDVFHVVLRLSNSDDEAKTFQSITSSDNTVQINSSAEDSIVIDVISHAKNVTSLVASNSWVDGLDADNDGDGVSNFDDYFPANSRMGYAQRRTLHWH